MITLNDYFEWIVCINRTARIDRWANVMTQCEKFKITMDRFEAHEATDCIVNGIPNANAGCTASHRSILGAICLHGYKRTLVLEDDWEISPEVGDAFPEMFDSMIREVPGDWDFLYLGAGYAEDAISRINGSVVRAGRLLTTSSYGITAAMARRMAPSISGVGPIDSLYGSWHRESKTYILDPRLMIQADGLSDLTGQYSRNRNSMLDTAHATKL